MLKLSLTTSTATFGGAGEVYLRQEMIHLSQPGGTLFSNNANATFSSDVTTITSMPRAIVGSISQ